ncbi:MAG: hypothetical protein V1736_07035 [Pseudomonadota bacterium]
MERNSLETTDIFRGAFFLCKGGDLCGIQMKGNGKRIAYFQIKGEGLARLDKEYRAGRALVNPLQFRESLNHLRDMLFKTLRNDTGRSRDDRKGDYRVCKAQR